MKNGIVPSYADNAAAESVIVDIAKFLSKYGYVAAFAGGIVLAGILASTMSTADSQLLAAASSISENLVQESFGVKLSVKKSMLLARISVVVISIIAIFLARNPDSSVFRIVSFAWAGFGAAFGRWCSAPSSGDAPTNTEPSPEWFREEPWSLSGNSSSVPPFRHNSRHIRAAARLPSQPCRDYRRQPADQGSRQGAYRQVRRNKGRVQKHINKSKQNPRSVYSGGISL